MLSETIDGNQLSYNIRDCLKRSLTVGRNPNNSRMRRVWYLSIVLALVLQVCSSGEVMKITDNKMDIFSTNYPDPYPSWEDKKWILSHTYGKWLIVLKDFHIQKTTGCTKDYLEISEENVRSKRLCGRITEEKIVSTGSNVTLHFHSEDAGTGTGFRLTVKRLLDEDDIRKKTLADAAKANVHKDIGLYESWMFKVLLGLLGCATLIFTALISFLCLEMRKKRLRRRSRQFINQDGGSLQWPALIRHDSKTFDRQNSDSSTAPLTINARY